MAAKADGYIRIDTKINTKPADAGLAKLTGSVKAFASMVGVAFGIKAVVDFGKASVKAATELQNALIGLESIADGTGQSFAAAQGFIEDYISDGLVPATNAVTAYKNLLARGYDTQQIQDVMTRLKDAAAFGRQASYSLGEAIQTASEGLKNENSILVDNAGVTKNVSQMWKEYAASIGVGVNSLTKAQKLQAEYIGIMNETRFQVGDAQKLTQTYSGQVSMLAFGFNNLKVALGNAIIPVLQAVLPHINSVITALTMLANKLAAFSKLVFGKTIVTGAGAAASGVESATESVDGLTESVEAAGGAGKDAAKGLAAFDKLATLPDAAGGSGGGAAVDAAIPELDSVGMEDTLSDAIESALDMGNYTLEISRVKITWEGLKERFAGIARQLLGQFDKTDIKGAAFRVVLNWIYAVETKIKLLTGVIGDLMIAFNIPATVESALEFMSAILETIGRAYESITPGIEAFVQRGLVPIAEWIGGKVRDAFTFFSEQITKIGDWFAAHEELFERIGKGLGDVAAAIWKLVEPLLDAAWEDIKQTTSTVLDSILYLGEKVLEILSGVIEFVAGAFTGDWDRAWSGIEQIASTVWSAITEVWGIVATWFQEHVINPVTDAFEGFKTTISNIWDAIWDKIRGVINSILSGIESFINGIVNGLNVLIKGLNDVLAKGDKVAEFLGFDAGLRVPTFSTVSLPRLAQGAVIPPNREFLAVLGDQKRGVNIETPLETMIQAFKTALAEMGGAGEQTINLVATLDGEVVYRNQQRVAKRRGRALIPEVT